MRIDQVNWITAHNYGEPKWHLFSPCLKPQSHYSDNQSPTQRQPTTIDNHRQPITDQIFDRQSVADQLQTSRQPIANHSPIGRRVNFGSSLKFENQSATGCHKINDWSATIRRSVADHSALGEQRLDKFMHTNLKLLL